MIHALRILVAVALVVAAALFLERNYRHARQAFALQDAGTDSLLSIPYPGIPDAVRAIREHGATVVHVPPLDEDQKLYQRLIEMLFPLEVRHVEDPAAELAPGDLYVVAPDGRPDLDFLEVHGSPHVLVLERRE